MNKGNAVLLGAVIAAVLAAFIIVGSIPVEKFVDDYGTDYGTVLVLNFEEGTGTTTFDQSPYGNDGSGYEASPTGAWLEDWDKRVKITLNSTDIDDNLSNFPVLIFLSNSTAGENDEDVSFIFDEIGANRKKIAITSSNKLTQLYVEVEKWNATNEQAWLWVKVPSVASSADTDIYLYYDKDQADNDAYVGDPSDAVVHNVWNNNFMLVTHMRDDPDASHVRDSTVNANDGIKTGAGNPAVTTAGRMDDAQIYDSANDRVTVTDDESIDFVGANTFRCWIYQTSYGVAGVPRITSRVGNNLEIAVGRTNGVGNEGELWMYTTQTGWDYCNRVLALDTWYFIAAVFDGDKWHVYVNTVETYVSTSTTVTVEGNLILGSTSGAESIRGIIDEARVLDTNISVAWIGASFESERDHLNDFGSEEEAGVPTPIIDWVNGKYGEAVNFTAEDSFGLYITIGDVSTSLRTIWFWTYLNTSSEAILQLKTGVYINVTDGVLSATGFAGTPTFYVNGEETTSITSGEWHHVAAVSDANEDASNFIIGCADADYLTGKIDQLRAFTVSKTAAEVSVQYLDPTGGMYSGSVIVSDDFKILGTDWAEDFTLEDGNGTLSGDLDIGGNLTVTGTSEFGGNVDIDDNLNVTGPGEFGKNVDMNLNYILYMPLESWIHLDYSPGVTDVQIGSIPAGTHNQDRHYSKLHVSVSPAPGVDKFVSVTLTDGTNSLTVSITGAETSGVTVTTAFDLDVSAETLTLKYSQTAEGASTSGCVMTHWHYKEIS